MSKPWLRTLCCVLGQYTFKLLSQYLSSPRCINGYWQPLCWGKPCVGLTSHPVGSRKLLVASCYRNWDKLWLGGPLGSYCRCLPFWGIETELHCMTAGVANEIYFFHWQLTSSLFTDRNTLFAGDLKCL